MLGKVPSFLEGGVARSDGVVGLSTPINYNKKTYHLPLAEWLGCSSFQKEENFKNTNPKYAVKIRKF
jgi:hypothetical protein